VKKLRGWERSKRGTGSRIRRILEFGPVRGRVRELTCWVEAE